MHHPTDRIIHITPVVEHWLEQEENLIMSITTSELVYYHTILEHLNNTISHEFKRGVWCKILNNEFKGSWKRRKCFIKWCTQHIVFMVIWHWTHGKGPLSERKPAVATTWATRSNYQQGFFICTIPQTAQYIPWPFLYQLLSTGCNKK